MLKNNPQNSRFEMDFEGHTVFADYRQEANILYITHVEAPPALRGTGAAGRFMTALAEEARKERFRIVPICGYAAAWLERHAEYRDLIATA